MPMTRDFPSHSLVTVSLVSFTYIRCSLSLSLPLLADHLHASKLRPLQSDCRSCYSWNCSFDPLSSSLHKWVTCRSLCNSLSFTFSPLPHVNSFTASFILLTDPLCNRKNDPSFPLSLPLFIFSMCPMKSHQQPHSWTTLTHTKRGQLIQWTCIFVTPPFTRVDKLARVQ